MPKERESELRHLGGKAFQPMHSSCMKKPTNRHKEASEFDVLSDLRDLSNKADKLAEKKLPECTGLDEWIEAIQKTMENIRDCKSIKDIKYPPSIETFFSMKNKDEKLVSPTIETTPILKLSVSVAKITPENGTMASNTQMVTPSTSVRKKINPFVLLNQLTAKEISMHSNEKSNEKNNIQLDMKTPVLNRTYDKINEIVVTDSGSTKNKNQTSNAINSNSGDAITRSGVKKENECPNSHGMITRSGSKRKSSDNKNKSNKKQKVDSHISSATLNKTDQHRRPLRDLKASVLASENRSKLSSVVKPPVLPKQSVVTKEQHILDEIKKKEKKREENLQKVMAERQLKAEQNKKTREEKRTKTLQKRIQLEKEKEEKREKSQAKINKENPKKATRAKELVEQHIKESKSLVIASTTQSTSNTNSTEAIVKTPAAASRKSDDIESYELTPVPDSSTYNFSDDEEERPTRKPIPSWAQGVLLKSALMQQYYYPVNTEEIFGSVIETPNLAEIFKVNKKRYLKRTSSAVWTSPPDRSYHL